MENKKKIRIWVSAMLIVLAVTAGIAMFVNSKTGLFKGSAPEDDALTITPSVKSGEGHVNIPIGFTLKIYGKKDTNYAYTIDFDDGTGIKNLGTSNTTSHTYTKAGIYTIQAIAYITAKDLKTELKYTITDKEAAPAGKCSDNTTKTKCNKDPLCQWVAKAGICKNKPKEAPPTPPPPPESNLEIKTDSSVIGKELQLNEINTLASYIFTNKTSAPINIKSLTLTLNSTDLTNKDFKEPKLHNQKNEPYSFIYIPDSSDKKITFSLFPGQSSVPINIPAKGTITILVKAKIAPNAKTPASFNFSIENKEDIGLYPANPNISATFPLKGPTFTVQSASGGTAPTLTITPDPNVKDKELNLNEENTLASYIFTNNTSESITIDSLTLTLKETGLTKKDFKEPKLYDKQDNKLFDLIYTSANSDLDKEITFNIPQGAFPSPTPIKLPSQEPVTIVVKATIKPNAKTPASFNFSLEKKEDIGTYPTDFDISATFPLKGPTFTVESASGGTASALTITPTAETPAEKKVTIKELTDIKGYSVADFKFTATGEDIYIKKINVDLKKFETNNLSTENIEWIELLSYNTQGNPVTFGKISSLTGQKIPFDTSIGGNFFVIPTAVGFRILTIAIKLKQNVPQLDLNNKKLQVGLLDKAAIEFKDNAQIPLTASFPLWGPEITIQDTLPKTSTTLTITPDNVPTTQFAPADLAKLGWFYAAKFKFDTTERVDIKKIELSTPNVTQVQLWTQTKLNSLEDQKSEIKIIDKTTGKATIDFSPQWTILKDTSPQYLIIKAQLDPTTAANTKFKIGINGIPGITDLTDELIITPNFPISGNELTVQEAGAPPGTKAKLTVTKVVSGGTLTPANFPLFITYPNKTTVVPAVSGQTYDLDPGAYTVTETNTDPKYAPSFSADCPNGIIDLSAAGINKVCTITNTFTSSAPPVPGTKAKLTVTKIVNGGTLKTSDFPLFITYPNKTTVSAVSGQTYDLDPGAYTVTETNTHPEYAPSFGNDCPNGIVDLGAVGINKICTLTNTYTPPAPPVPKAKLTVTKVVSGGTLKAGDFPLSIIDSKGKPIPAVSGQTYDLDQGQYVVSETNTHPEYAPSFSANCPNGITQLGAGITTVCTITNTYAPPLATVPQTPLAPTLDFAGQPPPPPQPPGQVTQTFPPQFKPSAPDLGYSQKLVKAPEKAQTGPEVLVYLGILAAIQSGLWLRKKFKK